MIIGGSAAALAIYPPVALAASAPTATRVFVPPTTKTIHLAGRIAWQCEFQGDDILRMLGLDPYSLEVVEQEGDNPNAFIRYTEEFDKEYGGRMDAARLLAENDHDIYERAELVIAIKRKLNLHFGFSKLQQLEWLYMPNPQLEGQTFQELMVTDLRQAAEVVDSLLPADQS